MRTRTFRNGTFELVDSTKIMGGRNFGKVLYVLRAIPDDGNEWLAMGKTKTETLTARKRDRGF